MTDLQILKIAVEHLKVLENKSQKVVGEMLGYTNESSFSQILNGKVPLPGDLFGKLEALNNDVKNFIYTAKNIPIEHPEGNITVAVNRNKKGSELIPYYNADFLGGKSTKYYDDGTNHPDYYMDIPEFSGCTAFRAYGESMENKIKPGAILFGRKLDDWFEDLEYGQIFGITLLSGKRYLKYIRRYEKDEDKYFLLKSENSEYDDFKLAKDKIKNVWLIEGWLDKRT